MDVLTGHVFRASIQPLIRIFMPHVPSVMPSQDAWSVCIISQLVPKETMREETVALTRLLRDVHRGTQCRWRRRR